MSRRAGFSLIELMTAILIMGMIAGFSIPAVAKALSGWNLHTSRELMISEFKLMRERAVSQGRTLSIWCSPGSSTYFFKNPTTSLWVAAPQLPSRVTFYSVSFGGSLPFSTDMKPDGTASKSGTIILANNRGVKDTVVVNLNGWVGQP
jgi:prepilin-type N-terminal cleavage/methylation domain-containing protein